MATMNKVDRERLHQLLDYALDNGEEYVIMEFARMDLEFHLHKTIYRLKLKKNEESSQ